MATCVYKSQELHSKLLLLEVSSYIFKIDDMSKKTGSQLKWTYQSNNIEVTDRCYVQEKEDSAWMSISQK